MKSCGLSSVSRTSRRSVSLLRSLRPRIEAGCNPASFRHFAAESNDRHMVSKGGRGRENFREEARCAPSGVAGCSPQRPKEGLPEGRAGERTGPSGAGPGTVPGSAPAKGRRGDLGGSSLHRIGSRALARQPCDSHASRASEPRPASNLGVFGLFFSDVRKKRPNPTLTGMVGPRQSCHARGRTDGSPSAASPRSRGRKGHCPPRRNGGRMLGRDLRARKALRLTRLVKSRPNQGAVAVFSPASVAISEVRPGR